MMRVLCLYDDQMRGHIGPLLRCRPQLEALGINLFCVAATCETALALLSAEDDAVLVHQTIVTERLIEKARRCIILERIDGAQLAVSRRWIDRCVGVIKGYSYRDRSWHNRHAGRRHCTTLRDAGVRARRPQSDTKQPRPQVKHLDRIHVGYGFGAYGDLHPFLAPYAKTAPRKYAVHYVGWTQYDGSEVEQHRKAALAAASRFGAEAITGSGRPLPRTQYANLMRHSRCVLSPWGWGEPTHRDYEAMATGAVLIKPDTDYVEAWPDIYHAGETYLACSPTWEDAPELIRRVGKDWKLFMPMRNRARQLAIDAFDPVKVAERLAALIKGLI